MDLEYLIESPVQRRHHAFANGTYESTTTCYVKFIHGTDMPLGGGEWADGCGPHNTNLRFKPLELQFTEGTVHLREPNSGQPPLMRVDRQAETGLPANHLQYGQSFFAERSGNEAYDVLVHALNSTQRPIVPAPQPARSAMIDRLCTRPLPFK